MSWFAFLTVGDGPPEADPDSGAGADVTLPAGLSHDIQLVGKGRALRVVHADGDESAEELAARLVPGAVVLECVLDRHHQD